MMRKNVCIFLLILCIIPLFHAAEECKIDSELKGYSQALALGTEGTGGEMALKTKCPYISEELIVDVLKDEMVRSIMSSMYKFNNLKGLEENFWLNKVYEKREIKNIERALKTLPVEQHFLKKLNSDDQCLISAYQKRWDHFFYCLNKRKDNPWQSQWIQDQKFQIHNSLIKHYHNGLLKPSCLTYAIADDQLEGVQCILANPHVNLNKFQGQYEVFISCQEGASAQILHLLLAHPKIQVLFDDGPFCIDIFTFVVGECDRVKALKIWGACKKIVLKDYELTLMAISIAFKVFIQDVAMALLIDSLPLVLKSGLNFCKFFDVVATISNLSTQRYLLKTVMEYVLKEERLCREIILINAKKSAEEEFEYFWRLLVFSNVEKSAFIGEVLIEALRNDDPITQSRMVWSIIFKNEPLERQCSFENILFWIAKYNDQKTLFSFVLVILSWKVWRDKFLIILIKALDLKDLMFIEPLLTRAFERAGGPYHYGEEVLDLIGKLICNQSLADRLYVLWHYIAQDKLCSCEQIKILLVEAIQSAPMENFIFIWTKIVQSNKGHTAIYQDLFRYVVELGSVEKVKVSWSLLPKEDFTNAAFLEIVMDALAATSNRENLVYLLPIVKSMPDAQSVYDPERLAMIAGAVGSLENLEEIFMQTQLQLDPDRLFFHWMVTDLKCIHFLSQRGNISCSAVLKALRSFATDLKGSQFVLNTISSTILFLQRDFSESDWIEIEHFRQIHPSLSPLIPSRGDLSQKKVMTLQKILSLIDRILSLKDAINYYLFYPKSCSICHGPFTFEKGCNDHLKPEHCLDSSRYYKVHEGVGVGVGVGVRESSLMGLRVGGQESLQKSDLDGNVNFERGMCLWHMDSNQVALSHSIYKVHAFHIKCLYTEQMLAFDPRRP